MFQHSAPSHRLHRAILIILLALLTLTLSITTRAAAPASDDASATVYDNGWQSSDNGGSGMGAWTLSTSGTAGHFIANCDIAVSSDCWGMYARDGGLSDAVRSFNSDMSAGEVFTMDMDNGSVQSGGTVGFGLLNNSGENLLEFYFVGGGSNYTVDDAAGDKSSGVGFTNTGLRIEITLTSSSTYYMAITNLATSSVTRFAGALKNPAGGQAIRQLRLFNANAGSGSSYDAFFNTITLASGPTAGSLVINEIDYDQLSTDDGEFVEIKNNGASAVNLDPYHLALLQGNGTDPLVRASIDLPNVSLAAGDYYVICGNAANVPNCDLDVTPDTNLLENGDPDGVALVLAGTIVDSVSYEGNVAAPFTEGTGIATDKGDRNDRGYDSLSRITDGNDSNHNDTDFQRVCGTPGLANVNNTSCGAYVATNGSDTNNNCGLATQPCATIGRGISRAGNYETINVAGGTYNEAPTLDGGTMNHWAAGGGGNDWSLNDLTISGGTVNAPPGTLILAGSGSDFPVLSNAGTFSAGTYTVEFRGIDDNPGNPADNANGQVIGSAAVTFHNVNIVNSDTSSFGVDFYATQRATINGTLTLNPRTFVAHAENGGTARSDGSPTYASGATLQYRTANPETNT
ncbi:MAG: lamin tail domain-containing protein, partial [Anaerolineales bacterium]|nr:lamin tail domain-containing protein [Anaerolineales bacterium]